MAEVDNREARRRRRILQQGSDRLAFIKGQIQTLPNPSSSDHPDTALPAPDLPHGDGEAEDDSNSVLQNRDASKSSITQTPPLDNKQDVESEIYPISSVPSSEIEPEYVQVQPQPEEPATPPDSPHEVSQQQPRAEEPDRFIIPSDVSSAINASRVTRLCCSVIMALLVVASYLGFSLLGTQFIKTVISFRPLYLVLLTNSTLVVARLVSGKQRGFGRSSRRRHNSTDSFDWDAQLARTLEIGMVLKSVADAVFMDCAVYAIVLICGLSLVHQ